jgi:hypothetical protein
VVAFEALTRSEPYPDEAAADVVEAVMCGAKRPSMPIECGSGMVSMISECWSQVTA